MSSLDAIKEMNSRICKNPSRFRSLTLSLFLSFLTHRINLLPLSLSLIGVDSVEVAHVNSSYCKRRRHEREREKYDNGEKWKKEKKYIYQKMKVYTITLPCHDITKKILWQELRSFVILNLQFRLFMQLLIAIDSIINFLNFVKKKVFFQIITTTTLRLRLS